MSLLALLQNVSCVRMIYLLVLYVTKRISHIIVTELIAIQCTFIVHKVKCSRYRPGVAQRVDRGIALRFHDRGTRRG